MSQLLKQSLPNLKVIEDKTEWGKALEEVENFDFYHTYDYHHISKKKQDKAVLLKYNEEDKLICLPLIVRKIENTSLNDATSVYGYAGPLQKNILQNFDNTQFLNSINIFFTENKIVSVFSRLNPFINKQEIILNGLGEITHLGNIVNIDLTKSLDEQRMIFSKTTKRYLNKGNKLITLRRSNKKEDILEFKKLYYENMQRVNAEDNYYFNEEYFLGLISSDQFITEVIFAILKETKEIISAAMMIKTNNIIQYHISGTKTEFLDISPIRSLIDHTRINGTEEKYQFFNLGGGLGSNEDSLFKFKSSFSKDLKSFKLWKFIVDQEAYNKLCSSLDAHKIKQNSNYFPLYRL